MMSWVVKFCLRTSALPALARFQVHCLVFWQINPCQAAVHEQRLGCATLMCPRNHEVNLLLTSWSLHLTCSHGIHEVSPKNISTGFPWIPCIMQCQAAFEGPVCSACFHREKARSVHKLAERTLRKTMRNRSSQ